MSSANVHLSFSTIVPSSMNCCSLGLNYAMPTQQPFILKPLPHPPHKLANGV